MRDSSNVFHLAIPCTDLDEAVKFYNEKLGLKLARRYPDRVTFDFFGDQLVCHLNPSGISANKNPYPRHFGITFGDKKNFYSFVKLTKERNIDLLNPVTEFDWQDEVHKDKNSSESKIGVRFENMPEEHLTIFLSDPFNNILEFKYYFDSRMVY
jgi:hypothetical protein